MKPQTNTPYILTKDLDLVLRFDSFLINWDINNFPAAVTLYYEQMLFFL